MSLAPSYPLHSASASSLSWRRFQKALALTGGALLLGCLIYAVEKYLFRPRHRFMESPAEVMMRAFAFGHFLVGWLFLFTSPRLLRPAALLRLFAATLIGIAACRLFADLGGDREPLLLVAFHSIFLIHETRDEFALACVSGDIPRSSPFAEALVQFVIVLLVTLLSASYLLRGFLLEVEYFSGMSGANLCAAWVVFVSIMIGLAVRLVLVGRKHHQTVHAALEAHLPLVQIYQALIVILFLGSLLGSVGLNIVIMLHVSVWLVFVMERPDSNRQPMGGRNVWTWLRETRAGFLTLHVGLIVLLLVLMAVRVHVWLRGGWISSMISSSSFPYWSLMHICMAFGARK